MYISVNNEKQVSSPEQNIRFNTQSMHVSITLGQPNTTYFIDNAMFDFQHQITGLWKSHWKKNINQLENITTSNLWRKKLNTPGMKTSIIKTMSEYVQNNKKSLVLTNALCKRWIPVIFRTKSKQSLLPTSCLS